jgi:8-oxo-dGTP diphosphatase
MVNNTMKDVDWVLFSVDPVIFTFHEGELSVLLVRRENEPYKNLWGLPGGRVDKTTCADLGEALRLKLKQKTGIDNLFFEQLGTYGSDSMDPRGWSVTTAYLALIHEEELNFASSDSTEAMMWMSLDKVGALPKLAFWHRQIIYDAFARLRDKSLYTDLPVNLMPEKFTYPALKAAYEKIIGVDITRQGFARRMDSANIFEDTGDREEGTNRPSPLYKKSRRGGAYVFPGLIKCVKHDQKI